MATEIGNSTHSFLTSRYRKRVDSFTAKWSLRKSGARRCHYKRCGVGRAARSNTEGWSTGIAQSDAAGYRSKVRSKGTVGPQRDNGVSFLKGS